MLSCRWLPTVIRGPMWRLAVRRTSLRCLRAARRSECLLGDGELLDLAGALVDAKQPGIAEESLDRDSSHIAGAAVYLQRAIGHPADHLAGIVFRARGAQ